jgi:hypothetical protein
LVIELGRIEDEKVVVEIFFPILYNWDFDDKIFLENLAVKIYCTPTRNP